MHSPLSSILHFSTSVLEWNWSPCCASYTSPASSWVSLSLPVPPCWLSWGLLSQPCSCLIYGLSPVNSTLPITSNIIYGPKATNLYLYPRAIFHVLSTITQHHFFLRNLTQHLALCHGRYLKWMATGRSQASSHGIQSHHFMANIWGSNWNSNRLYFLGFQNHCRWWLQPWN